MRRLIDQLLNLHCNKYWVPGADLQVLFFLYTRYLALQATMDFQQGSRIWSSGPVQKYWIGVATALCWENSWSGQSIPFWFSYALCELPSAFLGKGGSWHWIWCKLQLSFQKKQERNGSLLDHRSVCSWEYMPGDFAPVEWGWNRIQMALVLGLLTDCFGFWWIVLDIHTLSLEPKFCIYQISWPNRPLRST